MLLPKTAFSPCFLQRLFLYRYFLISLIINYKYSLICIPHEQRGAPASRTGHGCRNGRHGRLLRGHLWLLWRHVHLLLQGEPHLNEPLQGHERGIRAELRREEELPQVAHLPHLQGKRFPDQDRGHDSQPDHRGVLRRLLPSVREVHRRGTRDPPPETAPGGEDGGRSREERPRHGGHRPADKREGAAGGKDIHAARTPLGDKTHEAHTAVPLACRPHAGQGRLRIGEGTRRTHRGEIPQGTVREHHAHPD